MSRAVSVVDTCDISSPAALRQPWPKAAASRRYACSSAAVSGVESTDSASSIASSPRQRMPSLAATPRGSQLTRSYRSCREETVSAYDGIIETPEPPGPPKLNSREPMRSSPVASDRIRARSIVSPSGSAQSSGALSVAHRQSPSGAGESAVSSQRPQSSCWEASAFGTPDGAAAVGAAPLRPPSSLSFPDEPPLQPAMCIRDRQCGGGRQGRPPNETRHRFPPRRPSAPCGGWRSCHGRRSAPSPPWPVDNALTCCFVQQVGWWGQEQTVPSAGTFPSSR